MYTRYPPLREKGNAMKSAQKGFTLIEIAIVLVIIGLLLGGGLKGQSMIENAKVKALANEMRGVATMVYAYQDKFRAIPGDDATAQTHLGTTATQASGTTTGDGRINTGTWVGAATPAATNESSLFWQHVRLGGLATGNSGSGQATNAVGGMLGITSNKIFTDTAVTTGSFYVCASGIPNSLAMQLDTAMDDGIANSGGVAGKAEGGTTITAATAAGTDYTTADTYTVCMSM